MPYIIADSLKINILILDFTSDNAFEIIRIGNEFTNIETSKVIARRSHHYWQINCIYNRKKVNRCRGEYARPTVVLPYVDTVTNREVKRLFSKYKLEGNVCFKTETIYNLTATQTRKQEPTDKNEMKGVVYRAICKICNSKGSTSFYIGETGRKLKQRISEHMIKHRDRRKLNCHFSTTEADRNNPILVTLLPDGQTLLPDNRGRYCPTTVNAITQRTTTLLASSARY